jgi:phosphoadenosine phosphosulfate reductase
MKELLDEILIESRGLGTEQLLEYALDRFGEKISLASSFGAEDQVLMHMLCQKQLKPSVFTLDTGRLPKETHDVMEETSKRYGIEIIVLTPDQQEVAAMVQAHGKDMFYDSIENRKLCCSVRKINPLRKHLAGLDAWICGLRSGQSVTRSGLKTVEWDEAFGLYKFCPLADWTDEQVWDYIRKNDIPYNKLHDKGYPSIGCEPCTRAIKPGEDIRAGRWWWENADKRECGLHLNDEKSNTLKENK